tara:strand:+ start:39901 stop:40596 length:696 start_codon:yes stop_codon:yes gene_type:complete
MSVTISHSTPTAEVSIIAQKQGAAIIPTSSFVASFKPEPNSEYMISPVSVDPSLSIDSGSAVAVTGGIDAYSSVNISLGVQPFNNTANSMSGFIYTFSGFHVENIEDFSVGDFVVFNASIDPIHDSYKSKLYKADTSSMDRGATTNIFILKVINAGGISVMHKGFHDYELLDSIIEEWIPGQTLYSNNEGLSINPPTASSSWIRSVGFCVPNIDDKKRIWFEPDSTYIKRA